LQEAYTCPSRDPDAVSAAWKRADNSLLELLKSDCPIGIIPQHVASVAGDANKVDFELRLIIRTAETRGLKNVFTGYQETAQSLSSSLMSEVIPPDTFLDISSQPFAHGSDLYWATRGEQINQGAINVLHLEPIKRIAKINEWPLITGLVRDPGVSKEVYLANAVDETAKHEIAHSVLPYKNAIVTKRIGAGTTESSILEELKAESVGISLFLHQFEGREAELEEQAKLHLLSKIGVTFDSLVNKSSEVGSSGERYYYAAVTVFDCLLESGSLERNDDGTYTIIDAVQGLRAISSLGQEVLSKFYANQDSNSDKVVDYIGSIRALKQKTSIVQLGDDLRIV
jgi:hypothetical protein